MAKGLGLVSLCLLLQDIVIRNPDYVFTVSSQAIASASPDILAYLENILDLRSSEPWSYRRLPTPTATFPATIYSEEDDSENEVQRTRDGHTKQSTSKNEIHQRPDSFLQPKDDPNHDIGKQVRALRNKLQQIEMLEAKQSSGQLLDDQQITKLQMRLALESELAELGVPVETSQLKASSSVQPDGKGNKRVELSKKQRRKNKQMATPVDIGSSFPGDEVEPKHTKDFLSIEISQTTKNMASLLNSKIRFIIRRKMP
ncbi:uncharacterized protein LOC110757286 [Prunus avium]|uniref:Uncharacterized protein LOC110757286 n=1 Tax=Prunus avium TaxID=42229 RepID=A0A6P5SCC9_PRUAV|nr:uncharacterized protein LOC110757286 [Prunus avium]